MAQERIDIVISQKGAKEVKRDIEDIGTGAKSASAGVDLLKKGLAAVGIASATREAIKLSDAYTTITNRLRLATATAYDLQTVQKALFDISQRTRTDLATNAQLYNRLAIATKELGANQQTLLKFTEAVGNALTIGGGSAASTTGALLQLSQAIGTSIVRAEEFNSILEGAPRIAKAAADGLDKAGGSVARLRLLIAQGQVTSKEFFDAILSQAPQLAKEFEKTNSTIEQSFTRLKNSLTQFVGQAGQSSGASQTLAAAINKLADNVNLLANAFLIILTIVGVRYVVGMAAAARATVTTMLAQAAAARQAALLAPAMLGVGTAAATASIGATLLSRALMFFGGPIGIAISAVLIAISMHTNTAAEAQIRYNDTLSSFKGLAKETQSANSERAAKAKEDANKIIEAHIQELASLNMLIEGYAESNALLVGLREIAGKVGIGTAPSEVMARADALQATIKEMRALLANPNKDETPGGAGAGAAGNLTGRKTKAQLLEEENIRVTENTRLIGLNGAQREAEQKLIQFEQNLRQRGMSLNAEEEEQLRTKLVAYAELNQSLEDQQRLYESVIGPQESYTRGLAAANALLERGTITQKQYTDAVRDLRIAYLDTATDTASGFERGLLKVQKEFGDTATLAETAVTNMAKGLEDTLVNFSKTGKLNFRDMVDSMIADLTRLAIRQNLLQPLFGLGGGGGGGGGGGLLGSLFSLGASALSGSFGGSQGALARFTQTGNANFIGPLQAAVGASFAVPLHYANHRATKGYASGTSFVVPGNAGVDNQEVRFRASPGERVTVARSDQQGGRQNMVFNFNFPNSNPEAFRQSESQMAGVAARVIAKSRRNS